MNWNRMDGNGKQNHEYTAQNNLSKINLKQHWDKLTESELEMLNGKIKSQHVSHRDEFEPATTKPLSTKSRQHKRVIDTQK